MREEGGSRFSGEVKVDSLDKPLVSIITVTLNLIKENRESFFKQMMASVAEQDYGRAHIEHVIIDGGSDDGTVELIRDFDEQGAVDYWLSEPDSGIYSAMNKGFLASSGSVINFLNSDDYFTEDALSSSVQALLANAADFSYSKTLIVDGMDRVVRDCWLSSPEFLYFGMPGCHQSMFVRRTWFDPTEAFDTSFRIFADWNLMLSIYQKQAKPTFVDKYLVKFRSDGISDNWYENPVAQAEKSRIINDNYLGRIPLDEEAVRVLELFLIHPLSEEYSGDEIRRIFGSYNEPDKFMSDCLKLLVFSILNRNVPGVHGFIPAEDGGQQASNKVSDQRLGRWIYKTARRILK